MVLRGSLCVYSTNFTRNEEMNHSPQLLATLKQSTVFDKLQMLGFKSTCEWSIAAITGWCCCTRPPPGKQVWNGVWEIVSVLRRGAVTDCDSCTEGLTLHLYARPSRTPDDYE